LSCFKSRNNYIHLYWIRRFWKTYTFSNRWI